MKERKSHPEGYFNIFSNNLLTNIIKGSIMQSYTR